LNDGLVYKLRWLALADGLHMSLCGSFSLGSNLA